jgi:hypothetical protein
MQALEAVQLVQAVEKAKQRIPAEHRGPTYYSSEDVWLYEQSEHPNMCDECASYNLENFAGSDLRSMFPWHEVIDENFIYPKVHPHCFCGLVRLYPVESPGDEVYVVASSGNTQLSDSATQKLLSLPEGDFEAAVTGMLSVGYIAAGAADFIASLYNSQVKRVVTKKQETKK